MSAEEIMEILRGLDPGSVAAAGASYAAAADALETLAERIARHARTLSEHWDGTAADAALASLRHSGEQARSAAARAKRAGAALTWLGNEVLPMFRSLPDPAGQPYQPDAHAVASRYLAALDDYLTVAAKALPLCQAGQPRAGQSRAGRPPDVWRRQWGQGSARGGVRPRRGPLDVTLYPAGTSRRMVGWEVRRGWPVVWPWRGPRTSLRCPRG